MKEIYINDLVEVRGLQVGMVTRQSTIAENIKLLYTQKLWAALVEEGKKGETKDGFQFFDRFCQFILHVKYIPELGWAMGITDYKNDIDLALDHYNYLSQQGWDIKNKEIFMDIFQDIQNDPGLKAIMILRENAP